MNEQKLRFTLQKLYVHMPKVEILAGFLSFFKFLTWNLPLEGLSRH